MSQKVLQQRRIKKVFESGHKSSTNNRFTCSFGGEVFNGHPYFIHHRPYVHFSSNYLMRSLSSSSDSLYPVAREDTSVNLFGLKRARVRWGWMWGRSWGFSSEVDLGGIGVRLPWLRNGMYHQVATARLSCFISPLWVISEGNTYRVSKKSWG